MLRVGLTGGIACGKSHVARVLSEGGLHVLDLDRLSHGLMSPGGRAVKGVVEAFGKTVLRDDGSIDRPSLAAIVFKDAPALDALNAIVHPLVREEEAARSAALEADGVSVVVSEAALLVETGSHLRYDRLVVVHCDPAEQLWRLMARDALSREDALARVAAQMPISEKRGFAHLQIDTSGEKAHTDDEARALCVTLNALAASPPERRQVPRARSLGCLVYGSVVGPRGLSPVGLLRQMAPGVEMQLLGRGLTPPCARPWYRCAEGDPEEGPETLAAALAVWSVAARAPDALFLAAGAASLARLTHRSKERITAGCFASLALQDALVTGEVRRGEWGRLQDLAQGWGGAPLPSSLRASLEAALLQRGDPEEARKVSPGPGGALVGALTGCPEEAAPRDALAALLALEKG